MKKTMSILLLCFILSLSAPSAAEQAATKAVFDTFTITLHKVTKTADKLNIRLSAVYPDEATAAGYMFFLRDNSMTTEEQGAHYRDFLQNQWTRPTPDTRAGYKVVSASLKTLSGEAFPPEGAFTFSEFGASEAIKQPDGTWRREIKFTASGLSTREENIIIEFYSFDTNQDAPFPSAPEQILHIELP